MKIFIHTNFITFVVSIHIVMMISMWNFVPIKMSSKFIIFIHMVQCHPCGEFHFTLFKFIRCINCRITLSFIHDFIFIVRACHQNFPCYQISFGKLERHKLRVVNQILLSSILCISSTSFNIEICFNLIHVVPTVIHIIIQYSH